MNSVCCDVAERELRTSLSGTIAAHSQAAGKVGWYIGSGSAMKPCRRSRQTSTGMYIMPQKPAILEVRTSALRIMSGSKHDPQVPMDSSPKKVKTLQQSRQPSTREGFNANR